MSEQHKNDFRQGMQAWNSSSCNSGGNTFPFFQETAQGAGRQVTVTMIAGLNPDNATSCGRFSGNTISLYSQASTATGVRSCEPSAVLQDNAAHELGHLLGLAESDCQGHAMSLQAYTSSGTYIDRTLHGSECSRVDDTNYTPGEQLEDQCALNPELPGCGGNLQCLNYGCQSPVVIDLEGDGFLLTGTEDAVRFDIDGDGAVDNLAWTSRRVFDAFLCRDRNLNGQIDDGTELFGNSTPFLSGDPAPNGYLALFELDVVLGNGNGFIDPGDEVFGQLCLWVDRNHNGKSEPRELLPLAEAGIAAISTEYSVSLELDQHGNELRYLSLALIREDDGSLRTVRTVDVFFLLAKKQPGPRLVQGVSTP